MQTIGCMPRARNPRWLPVRIWCTASCSGRPHNHHGRCSGSVAPLLVGHPPPASFGLLRGVRSNAGGCKALRALQEGSGQRGGLDPSLERAVPPDQRPVNELEQLRKGQLYSWATLSLQGYMLRLGLVWAGFFAVIGGPIAYQTFDPFEQPMEFLLSGNTGALLVVLVAVLRIYLGWQYVGDRLLSAAIAYEETGWYDGQTFVKPPDVLARDRLLGTYEVKPTLARLKVTLLGAGGALMLTAVVLAALIASGSDSDGVYGRGAARAPRVVTSEGIIYSDRVRSLGELKDDDEAAAAEAAAQAGVWSCLTQAPVSDP